MEVYMKTVFETVHEVVDSQIDPTTGAVLTSNSVATKTTQVVHKAEPQYVKLYIKDMLYMRDMPKGLSDITLALARRATYADSSSIDQGLRVALTPYIKEEICRECGYTNVRSLNNDLTKLVKGCIIKRLGTGTYQLNPHIFGKGEWKDIESIQATWDYNDIKGKTFNTVFSYFDKKEKPSSNKILKHLTSLHVLFFFTCFCHICLNVVTAVM